MDKLKFVLKSMIWQPMMKDVMVALIPLIAAAIFFFGLRFVVVFAAINIAAFLTEYVYSKKYHIKMTAAVFVTSFLFALVLPPTIPIWMACVGAIFAILFGKMVFGGFGKNIFNPALSARAFLYISFGLQMTSSDAWRMPFTRFPGGFASFLSDATTSATPIKLGLTDSPTPLLSLFFGTVPGSFGETSALLIILSGIYLVYKKSASWKIIVSTVISMLVFQYIFFAAGFQSAVSPIYSLISGGFLFGTVFMATDPISAARTEKGKIIYGVVIGSLTSIIRTFSVWPEGIMFAILLGNMFAPMIDVLVKECEKIIKKRKQNHQEIKVGTDG